MNHVVTKGYKKKLEQIWELFFGSIECRLFGKDS